MMDETRLIETILTGNKDAYRNLVERYQTGLIIHCENILKSREDGEDIAQEAFIKAFKNLETFSQDKANFSTWLYKIATNLCIDSLRKNKRKVELKDIEQHVGAFEPDYIKDEEIELLRQAVELLEPPKYAQVIKAYFWEGKSYEDIAEQFSTSRNTIGTWISRAKLQLKEQLS